MLTLTRDFSLLFGVSKTGKVSVFKRRAGYRASYRVTKCRGAISRPCGRQVCACRGPTVFGLESTVLREWTAGVFLEALVMSRQQLAFILCRARRMRFSIVGNGVERKAIPTAIVQVIYEATTRSGCALLTIIIHF